MLSKIFIKNFSAHKNNYLVYIMASSSAVMVYFILYFITWNPELKTVENWNTNLGSLTTALSSILIFMEWIFVAYISGILIKERKKEFNLYKFLGISKYRISLGIFFETFFIQFISWIVGFVFAIIFSKMFGMILIRMMHLSWDFHFYLNTKILQSSLWTFIFFTLLLAILNMYRIIRQKNKYKQKKEMKFVNYIIGILGVLLILYGYFQVLKYGGNIIKDSNYSNYNTNLAQVKMFWIFVEVVIGTYLFYVGFIEAIIEILKKFSIFKYNGLKNLTSNLFEKSIKKNVSSLWLITVMSGLSIVMLFFAIVVYQSSKYHDDTLYSYDIGVNSRDLDIVKKYAQKNKQDFKEIKEVPIKQNIGRKNKDNYQVYSFISYKSYKKAIGKKAIKYNSNINPNEIMSLTDSTFGDQRVNDTYTLLIGKKIHVKNSGIAIPISPNLYYGSVIVVPDKLYESLSADKADKIYGINFKKSINRSMKKDLDNLTMKTRTNNNYLLAWINQKNHNVNEYKIDSYKKNSQKNVGVFVKNNYTQSYASSVLGQQTRGFLVFIFSVLSVVFIVALGSILSIKQFVENNRNIKTYETIKKIGIGQKNINKLIFRQTFLLFYLPISLAIIHAIMAANYLMAISINSYWILFLEILTIYLIIYTLLFVITQRISKLQISKEINH
ncbi:FtsX-like permease family protein [Companilactobacillus sp. DQM5]|uniref:FtsX-like permease family protein n=1 Tax=Companilactobacillus sp. DQM5 TaxID=3463359 RepID=UPI004058F32E